MDKHMVVDLVFYKQNLNSYIHSKQLCQKGIAKVFFSTELTM